MKIFFLRNGNEITCAFDAGFLFVFEALKQAHSRLRNCFRNKEDGQKDKSNVQVIKFTFLSLLVFLLQACSSSSETHIKQAELLSLLQSEQSPPIIVDVRSSSEYKSGHIPHAQHIPFWQSFTTDALDNSEKQKDVILYCEHGPRAGIAKFAYYMAGFKKIRYVEGHMTAWRKAGLPMEQ